MIALSACGTAGSGAGGGAAAGPPTASASAFSDNNAEELPGQLLLTSNGGASWQRVSY